MCASLRPSLAFEIPRRTCLTLLAILTLLLASLRIYVLALHATLFQYCYCRQCLAFHEFQERASAGGDV